MGLIHSGFGHSCCSFVGMNVPYWVYGPVTASLKSLEGVSWWQLQLHRHQGASDAFSPVWAPSCSAHLLPEAGLKYPHSKISGHKSAIHLRRALGKGHPSWEVVGGSHTQIPSLIMPCYHFLPSPTHCCDSYYPRQKGEGQGPYKEGPCTVTHLNSFLSFRSLSKTSTHLQQHG